MEQPHMTAGSSAASAVMHSVNLTGTVESSRADRFVLDCISGRFIVLMDEDGWYRGDIVQAGDRVTVTGTASKTLADRDTLIADTLFVDGRTADYVADRNGRDGRGGGDGWLSVSARVASATRDTIELDIWARGLTVDLGGIRYKPRLAPGDLVSVYGTITDGGPDGRHRLVADGFARLSPPG